MSLSLNSEIPVSTWQSISHARLPHKTIQYSDLWVDFTSYELNRNKTKSIQPITVDPVTEPKKNKWNQTQTTRRKKEQKKRRTSQPNRIKSSLTKRYSVATWEKDNSNTHTHIHMNMRIRKQKPCYTHKSLLCSTDDVAHKQFYPQFFMLTSSMSLFPTCTSHVSGFNVLPFRWCYHMPFLLMWK